MWETCLRRNIRPRWCAKRKDATMGVLKRFGEMYRSWKREAAPADVCEVCGGELEIDPESGDGHCPVCESSEQ